MPIGIINNSTYSTLSAMITPAIFMTANASLIISTSNRVSRVVDRIRVLNDQADKLGRGVSDLDLTDQRMDHLTRSAPAAPASERPSAVRLDRLVPGLLVVCGNEPGFGFRHHVEHGAGRVADTSRGGRCWTSAVRQR